jgi:hypothetical protein
MTSHALNPPQCLEFPNRTGFEKNDNARRPLTTGQLADKNRATWAVTKKMRARARAQQDWCQRVVGLVGQLLAGPTEQFLLNSPNHRTPPVNRRDHELVTAILYYLRTRVSSGIFDHFDQSLTQSLLFGRSSVPKQPATATVRRRLKAAGFKTTVRHRRVLEVDRE